MANYARRVTIESAKEIVSAGFQGRDVELRPIGDDLISTCFSFSLGDGEYVAEFRDSNMAWGMIHERMFRDRFKRSGIPVRDVLFDGSRADLRYAVHRRPEGAALASLPQDEFRAMLPAVFAMILRISETDIRGTRGFGWFREDGRGIDPTWARHVSRIGEEEPGFFFGAWHGLFEKGILEKKAFEDFFRKMTGCLDRSDPPRVLVHGSFSTFNVLVKDGGISAVQDWQDARFGDGLFDVAALDYWPTGVDIAAAFREYAGHRGISYPRYEQRIRAYKYYLSLGNMIYFAMSGDARGYGQAVRIAESLG